MNVMISKKRRTEIKITKGIIDEKGTIIKTKIIL
jgi:hypothetical protein